MNPMRVNALSILTTEDGIIVTIGSPDSPTKQYILGDPQMKMLIEETVRVYSASRYERPIE
jgi:hypothetical protein